MTSRAHRGGLVRGVERLRRHMLLASRATRPQPGALQLLTALALDERADDATVAGVAGLVEVLRAQHAFHVSGRDHSGVGLLFVADLRITAVAFFAAESLLLVRGYAPLGVPAGQAQRRGQSGMAIPAIVIPRLDQDVLPRR